MLQTVETEREHKSRKFFSIQIKMSLVAQLILFDLIIIIIIILPAYHEMIDLPYDPFIPRNALSMTSSPSQINHRRLIRQYWLKPPLRQIKLIVWPNCHFDDMFKVKNFSVWHFISCIIGAVD